MAAKKIFLKKSLLQEILKRKRVYTRKPKVGEDCASEYERKILDLWWTTQYYFIWRHLYASIQAAQTPTSKLRFVTTDKESSMSTLWQEEEFKQICSRESLMEKAADIEKTIVVKEHERARYDFDPTMFYENRFWNRGPDGIMINKYHRTLYILART